MYRKITDFIEDWQGESALTAKIFESIDFNKINEQISPDVRTLGRLAWHITQTITEMGSKLGLFEEDELEHEALPLTQEALLNTYQKYAAAIAQSVQQNWVDASLLEMKNMYNEQWEKGKGLLILVKHQTHHRAQMTVLMRLLGMKVTGTYGPAKEEWAAFGMPPMD